MRPGAASVSSECVDTSAPASLCSDTSGKAADTGLRGDGGCLGWRFLEMVLIGERAGAAPVLLRVETMTDEDEERGDVRGRGGGGGGWRGGWGELTGNGALASGGGGVWYGVRTTGGLQAEMHARAAWPRGRFTPARCSPRRWQSRPPPSRCRRRRRRAPPPRRAPRRRRRPPSPRASVSQCPSRTESPAARSLPRRRRRQTCR
ncbi:hypothetical protein FGB62_9g314 [Gracilaria domingensis]|nr:hypothetical protein FGB62_9g314 [Gracilaria domingensis]